MTTFSYFVLVVCIGSALSAHHKKESLKKESIDNESLISKGVTIFGDGLLKTTLRTGENILVSPLNVYSALALTYLGSAGNTRKDLQRILVVASNENETTVHRGLNELVTTLETRPAETNSLFTETAIANGLFVQNGFNIKERYLEKAERFYKSEPIIVDFAEKPQVATDTVNKWVSSMTKNRVPKLYESPIEPSTLVLLTCALYFSGKWEEPFGEYRNSRNKFTTENGETIDVLYMNNAKFIPYFKNTALQYEAIRLPYGKNGNEKSGYEMIIAVPTGRQTVKNLIERLKYDDYRRLFDDPGTEGITYGVNYTIPRIKFSWKQSLKEALIAGGIRSLFEKANLTNMVEATELKVSDIVHATEIDVSERGTKASAVTGIKFVPYVGSMNPSTPKPFVANKPFVMMIYNKPTSTLLFFGCVYNPVSSS